MPERTHELPPRDDEIAVAGPFAETRPTVEWLRGHGRRAKAVDVQPCAERAETGRFRLWRPTAFLSEVLPALRPGRALDLACGTGRDAVELAAHGWDVTAVDVLPDALERGRGLARRSLGADPITWQQADVERGVPPFGARFDLIVLFRYWHRPLVTQLGSWLETGGSVLVEIFTPTHRRRHGKPAGERTATSEEVAALLSGLHVRVAQEGWYGAVHTARVWAMRG